jgi:hypothetical protein
LLYQLSYRGIPDRKKKLARMTGFEPAASGVTGRRSKPLSYTRARKMSMTPSDRAMQRIRRRRQEIWSANAFRTPAFKKGAAAPTPERER